MDGLSRTDAIDWFKACDTATLVLERIAEVPSNQLRTPGAEGVCEFI